jgi:hypothetical protein
MKNSLALSFALAFVAAPVFGQTTTLPQKNAAVAGLLDRATGYVTTYVHAFSRVVAEEHYVQDSHPMPRVDGVALPGGRDMQTPQHADLRSDLLFVRTDPSDDWLTFRDVCSVNGHPVRDRAERLSKLLTEPVADTIDRAAEIAREGYRYNVGSKDRTVASPLLAMAFLQPAYRDRFEFRISGIDTSLGPDVWILKFQEKKGPPTILRTSENRNVMSKGRFWIDGATGRVLQTELETSVQDRVMTIFTFDERLGLDVPSEMRDIAWQDGTVVTGTATYANFRRFEVTTDEKVR